MKKFVPMKKNSNRATPLLFLMFIHLYTSFFFHQIISYSYNPSDNIAINCGSSSSDTPDGRNWTRDIDYFTVSTQQNASTTSNADTQHPSVPRTPYMTARIILSQFTYTFPISSSGPKFIRFHFYPTFYSNGLYDRSKAFFSVKVGSYTLLSNFSPSLTADFLNKKSFSREFSINIVGVDSRLLNITFFPNKTSTPDAYAFVNGIEVVSIASDIYPGRQKDPIILVPGQTAFYFDENNTALETVCRLNIGGNEITPTKDTGMFRNWDMEIDSLAGDNHGVVNYHVDIKISYTSTTPNYTAPVYLYQTGRSMGMDSTTNQKYNLTWFFPIDTGFNYLVRLHFCETEATKVGDRPFFIFINNQTAVEGADILLWSGGKGVPVYKDYAVGMFESKQEKLFLALHPDPGILSYPDALLNGLEIFKLSSDNNLAAPNPPPVHSFSGGQSVIPKKTNNNNHGRSFIVPIVGGITTSVIALCIVYFFVFRHRRKVTTNSGTTRKTTTKPSSSSSSSLPSDFCRRFSFQEIKAITNNFDETMLIGTGGFGNVYKGYINGGTTTIAIKRANPESQQGVHEFQTEIKMLSKLRHLHLVSLIGYCDDDDEMILVYDYMINGTLRDHLYKTKNPPLTWNQRLKIIIGAGKGLNYLHTGVNHTIIHRDIKSTNILLDEKWVAKVSDFGLSKLGPTSLSYTHVSTDVKGTLGYLDPEYFRRQQLTEKSDVYSFGVVLFEVLCGRPAVTPGVEREKVCLTEWAQCCNKCGTLDQIVDPFLRGEISSECLKIYVEIAEKCVCDTGTDRPAMSDVVGYLEFALGLQEKADEEICQSQSKFLAGNEQDMISKDCDEEVLLGRVQDLSDTTSSGNGTSVMSKSGPSLSMSLTDYSSDGTFIEPVFSEIMNPSGR